MESDHLAHFGVRLQCLWTFTLPNSIFGVVRATNNREAASIQAYSGCGVDCGVQHRCCRHAKLRGSTCSRLQAWEGPKATSTVCSVRVHRYLRLTVFFLPKPSPSLPEQLGRSSLRCTQLANLCYTCCVQEQEMLEEAKNTAVHSWDAMKGADSFITTLIVIVRRTQD